MDVTARSATASEPLATVLGSRRGYVGGLLTSVGALNALALTILLRRGQGALEGPAPPLALLCVVGLVLGATWLVRTLWRKRITPLWAAEKHKRLEVAIAWGPSVAIMVLTPALSSWPFERLFDWLVWTPVWVTDLLWRQSFLVGESFAQEEPLPSVGPPARGGELTGAAGHANETTEDVQSEAEDLGEVLQQLTRLRDELGHESVTGLLRADLAAGEQHVSLHVAFCPPFRSTPSVHCEQVSGPTARVKVAQSLPYGARLEVRLLQVDAQPTTVGVELAALEQTPASAP